MRIQKRIFRATREGNFKQVKKLQKLLSGSREAILLSIRRVTQINRGRFTSGVDGKVYRTNEEREMLACEILNTKLKVYRCAPVRRVRIPKPGKMEKRPLGIPTIRDRVFQMIVKLALEPEWEAKFERNSYGFRPGRRCMDAVTQIRINIVDRKGYTSSSWILDADISKCFDSIDHEALLQKIPVFTSIIRQWLKAGVVEFGQYYMTKAGTPQGGIISPLLANIALDGMERLFGSIRSSGKYAVPSQRRGNDKGIGVIRYADDFVITAPTRERIVNYVIPKIRDFLGSVGLTLSGAKTRIVHRDEGLDFLGFTIREFVGKRVRACLVQPSKVRIAYHLNRVKSLLDENKQATQAEIIDMLNPILRGWASYYKYANSKKVFSYVDYRMWVMLWQWCRRRHEREGKGARWIVSKYFRRVRTRYWTFADAPEHALFYAGDMKLSMFRYVKVKGEASPFDPELNEYWFKRQKME
ncbi:MAG: group II intron reverse transcriptase/maturase [Candidatus Lokiarchaeota archaeon]|nr:group II intron reverse transcriptase/maturase [Candidatus Lokiarchaeota archaeon]